VIKINDFPWLSLLTKDRGIREIDPEEAFYLYEINWPSVDVDRLLPCEAELIRKLITQFVGVLWM